MACLDPHFDALQAPAVKSQILGFSQLEAYSEIVDAEIGARVRARMQEILPGTRQGEIAARIRLTPDAFSRSLNGKRAFTAIELVELAELLKTSAHWFVSGEPDPFEVKVAGRQTFDASTMTHAAADWTDEQEVQALIGRAYVQVRDSLPSPSWRPTRPRATETRTLLESEYGPNCVRRLADAIDQVFEIEVVRIEEARRDYSLEILGHRVIVLRANGNWFYENWSIAHELSHLLAGEVRPAVSGVFDDPVAERRANAFAAELLMPEARMRSIDWGTALPPQVAELLWEFGVSTRALSNRLAGLHIRVGAALQDALSISTQRFLRMHWSCGTGDEVSERMQAAAVRRFPLRLIEAHREAVVEGRIGAGVLGWMLGARAEALEAELAPPFETPDIDWLGRELGLLD